VAAQPGTGPDLDSARGWVTVAAAFVSMAVVFGVAYGFGAFFEPMATEFGTSNGATSLVFGVTAGCWFLLGSVTGPLADRVGPRPMLLVAAVALTAGLLLTAAVERLWLGYLTYGIGVGVAVACGYVPTVAAVGGWFARRRAVALAVAVAGIGVGTLLGAPLAAALIAAEGWRQTHVVFGIAGGALLLACALAVRRPPEPVDAAPARGARALVRTPEFRWLYTATLLSSVALFATLVFLPPYATAAGASPVAAASLVGIIGVSSVVGRLAIGALADRARRLRTFRMSFAVLAASFLIWLAAELVAGPFELLVVFAAVLGVGYGGWIALQPAVLAELFGVRGLGGVVGLSYTSSGFGALAGAPLAGVLVDVTGGYGGVVVGAGLAGLGAYLALRPLGRADFSRSSRPL
jgi:MFS family permease